MSSDHFKAFIRQVQARAKERGIHLPMSKLRDALSVACFGRTYSATVAALDAGKETRSPLPARAVDEAAARYGVDPAALHDALNGHLERMVAAAPLFGGLPAIERGQRWHVIGAPGTGKTTLGIALALQSTATGGRALYLDCSPFGRIGDGRVPQTIEQQGSASGEAMAQHLRRWSRRGPVTQSVTVIDEFDYCDDIASLEDAVRVARKRGCSVVVLSQRRVPPVRTSLTVLLRPHLLRYGSVEPWLLESLRADFARVMAHRSFERDLIEGFSFIRGRPPEPFAMALPPVAVEAL